MHYGEARTYTGEKKQPLSKPMAQHRRATSTRQNSAVYLHLKDKKKKIDGLKEECKKPSTVV